MSTDPTQITVTLGQMAQAFEAWEDGFRAMPENFLTHEQCALVGVSELSANRAEHFYSLLTQVRRKE